MMMNYEKEYMLNNGKSKDGYEVVFLDNVSVGYIVGVEIGNEFFYWAFYDRIGYASQMFDWLLNNNVDSYREEWKSKKHLFEKRDGNSIYFAFYRRKI